MFLVMSVGIRDPWDHSTTWEPPHHHLDLFKLVIVRPLPHRVSGTPPPPIASIGNRAIGFLLKAFLVEHSNYLKAI